MEIITEEQLTPADKSQLMRLLHACFGGLDSDIWQQAMFRSLIRMENKIVAHAAVSIRLIDLHSCEQEVAILGMVCVDDHERGRHLGYQIIQNFHQSLRMPFILNCGRGLVSYYEKIGYKEISPSASYLRNGIIVIDLDPVMLFENGTSVSAEMRKRPIFLGTDF